MNSDVSPLNINLLIPFKDNKGQRQKLYQTELNKFEAQLEGRIGEIKEEIVELFGQEFHLALAGRSDGNSKRYYWRFKSSKMDRKFNRLFADSVISYLAGLDSARKLRIREMEEEVILINSNLKLVKAIRDAMALSAEEIKCLREMQIL